MALGQRHPGDVIIHSDQGSQFTSPAFGNRCREAGMRPSMGFVGDAYDNALCESLFASLECELLARRRLTSQAEARMAVFTHVEAWYNPIRLHSALGYKSPAAFEKEQTHPAAALPGPQVPQSSTKTGQSQCPQNRVNSEAPQSQFEQGQETRRDRQF